MGEGKERKNALVQSSLLMLKIKGKEEKKDTENTKAGGRELKEGKIRSHYVFGFKVAHGCERS